MQGIDRSPEDMWDCRLPFSLPLQAPGAAPVEVYFRLIYLTQTAVCIAKHHILCSADTDKNDIFCLDESWINGILL